MMLFVGLGNPGSEYEKTRHNVGFMIIDEIVKSLAAPTFVNKFDSEFSKIKDLYFLKPQTYMNRSGIPTSSCVRFFKIPLENIFVFHDDIDLEFGKIKVKIGGGNGGHNGLKSLDEFIGKNYYRVRIGVGKPEYKNQVASYVLSNFTKLEMELVQELSKAIIHNFNYLLEKRIDLFMNKISLELK